MRPFFSSFASDAWYHRSHYIFPLTSLCLLLVVILLLLLRILYYFVFCVPDVKEFFLRLLRLWIHSFLFFKSAHVAAVQGSCIIFTLIMSG
ncbi:hypothetical protein M413DRAFT_308418 [Hebeloma cylindrosporum]|uniref:Uncharacterized protein n=1 Tax=Hebeloma cylindrosporum TaxID=76867 RepID=A0A0C3CQ65_HEBCY|nr:hypothetical protein M413DRAFT_308418 [Hebeloma cylindrosporum h7]